jgi:hypothetical protein
MTPRNQGTPRRVATALGALALAAGFAACGGGERQDVDEPEGTYPVEVVKASFPKEQHLAGEENLQLEIRNTGDQAIPNLAVTIWTGDEKADGSFNELIQPPTPSSADDPSLANPSRPVWVLEDGYPKILTPELDLSELDDAPSAGAVAAQTDTFQFGTLPPDESKTMVWRVTPVKAGNFTVHYEVAAGLQGKAKAQVTQDGAPVKDLRFVVTISDKPPQTCVNAAGKVVKEGNCGF